MRPSMSYQSSLENRRYSEQDKMERADWRRRLAAQIRVKALRGGPGVAEMSDSNSIRKSCQDGASGEEKVASSRAHEAKAPTASASASLAPSLPPASTPTTAGLVAAPALPVAPTVVEPPVSQVAFGLGARGSWRDVAPSFMAASEQTWRGNPPESGIETAAEAAAAAAQKAAPLNPTADALIALGTGALPLPAPRVADGGMPQRSESSAGETCDLEVTRSEVLWRVRLSRTGSAVQDFASKAFELPGSNLGPTSLRLTACLHWEEEEEEEGAAANCTLSLDAEAATSSSSGSHPSTSTYLALFASASGLRRFRPFVPGSDFSISFTATPLVDDLLLCGVAFRTDSPRSSSIGSISTQTRSGSDEV